MKKLFLFFAAGTMFLISCKGHGPLCPAYSTLKKAQNAETASMQKPAKEIPS